MFKKTLITTSLAATLFFAPTISEAALGDQTLYQGMKNNDVVQLQNKLNEKGFFNYNRSTGYYGSITKSGVIAFQKQAGIKVDGIAGPQTVAALMAATGETLRYGSRGQAVKSLQRVLAGKGYYKSSTDGVFGPLTKSAVIRFQRSRGLGTDGIVGPKTYAALSGTKTAVKAASTTRKPFIKPTKGVLTANVGDRWNSYHAGVDISRHGTVKVAAAAGGVVERSYYSKSYGNVVFISHRINGKKYTTVYAHLRKRLVSTGQRVAQGQSIGYQGNSGNSTGQHLHFEVHKGNWNVNKTNAVNPMNYMG